MSRSIRMMLTLCMLALGACSNKPAAEKPLHLSQEAPPAAVETTPAPVASSVVSVAPATEPVVEPVPLTAMEAAPAVVEATPVVVPVAPARVEPNPTPAAKPAASSVPSKAQAMALAAKGNCLACHKVESRMVGPAWQAVGAKYKGDAQAVKTLAAHIKTGGSFGWKMGAMPPRGGSKLSDGEIAELAAYIATLR